MKETCTVCRGFGQTKAPRTEFHFEEGKRERGQTTRRYVTDRRGSGCPKCLGVGVTDV